MTELDKKDQTTNTADKKVRNSNKNTVRINIIKSTDNRILIDAKTFESIIDNKIIDTLSGNQQNGLDTTTLIKVKKSLSDIVDTAVNRIKEQEATAAQRPNLNQVKEIELDYLKLLN